MEFVPKEPSPIPAWDPIIVSLPGLEPQQVVTDSEIDAIAVRYSEFEAMRIVDECGLCVVCRRRIYDPTQTGLCLEHQDRADLRGDMERL